MTNLPNPSPTAAPVQGEEIPYETIRIGEDSNYEDESPGLAIAGQPAEIAPLEKVVFRMPGGNLDPNEIEDSIAVAVFQGWKPTNKYGVEVQRVTRAGAGEVRLYTHFTEPDPNFEKAPIITPLIISSASPARGCRGRSPSSCTWTARSSCGRFIPSPRHPTK